MKSETEIDFDAYPSQAANGAANLLKDANGNYVLSIRTYGLDTSTVPPTVTQALGDPKNINRVSVADATAALDKLEAEQQAAVALTRAGLAAISAKMDQLDLTQ